MDDIFRPYVKFCAIYIDDILFISKNWKDHIDHLKQFYDIVYNHGPILSSKEDTLIIGSIEFDFLGLSYNTCVVVFIHSERKGGLVGLINSL